VSAVGVRRRRRWVLPAVVALAFFFLLFPIGQTFVYSFNDAGRTNVAWNGFTWENWLTVCAHPDVCAAFGNSILVGLVSTALATTLGTLLAIALTRYRFRARGAISLLLFLPLATPEVVLGAGLASQFLTAGIPKSLGTVIIAHTLFCVSFVVVTVRARVLSLDPALEEAGRDLYGAPMQVFWRITFPLLLPGIVAAALLAFSLSFDEFIITYFTAGADQTFPVYVYVAAQRGIPPQANVIASAVFLLAIAATLAWQIAAARAARARR
jgi:spermidine/putrescine transport system permease protein